MKRILITITALLCCSLAWSATIKDGTILYSVGSFLSGEPISLGVDPYGYNYNARRFSGSFFNAYANSDGFESYSGNDAEYLLANPMVAFNWAWPYRETQVAMKWNDAWLSNKDLNNDGALDRHHGFASYIGSGAWLTNHMSGSYMVSGQEIRWNYFTKIVAAPAGAVRVPAIGSPATWYDSSGKELGPDIWGQFITLQEVYNDPGAGAHGLAFRSKTAPGLGKY